MSDRVLVMREGRLVAELARRGDAGASDRGSGRDRGGMIARFRGLRPQEIAAAAFRLRELGIVIALGVAVIFFAIRAPNFLTVSNWQDIAKDVAIVIVVAVGETMVVLTRNIDLSVGSMVGLSAYLSADFLARHNGAPLVLVALIAIGIGIVLGLVNGLLVVVGRIPAIIATLATLAIYRGLSFEITAGDQVSAFQLPDSFLNIASRKPLGLPMLAWFAVVVAFVGAAVLRWTPWGRDFYAIGSNPEAARFAGIRAGRRVILAFTLCGALAGLGGFMGLALPQRRRRRRRWLRTRRDHCGGHRRSQCLRRLGLDSRRRSGRSARRDDSGRLHAATAVGVLEDVLQRRRDRRCDHDRRPCHTAVAGHAATAARRGSRRAARGASATSRGRDVSRLLLRLVVRWETLLVVAIIGVSIWSTSLSPFFLTRINLLDLITPYVFIGLMALELTFGVIAGEIDISVTAILVVSVVSFAQLLDHGLNVWIAALVGLVVAAALGLVNGALVALVNLPSLAVTLGTLAAFQGLAFVVLSGEGVAGVPAGVPEPRRRIHPQRAPRCARRPRRRDARARDRAPRHPLRPVPVLDREQPGGSPLSGVPATRVRVTIFVTSGFMAGIAGSPTWASSAPRAPTPRRAHSSTSSPPSSSAARTSSGAGSMLGVFLAVILVAVLRNGMQLANLGDDPEHRSSVCSCWRPSSSATSSEPHKTARSGSGERRWSGTTHRRRHSPVPWNQRLRKEGK